MAEQATSSDTASELPIEKRIEQKLRENLEVEYFVRLCRTDWIAFTDLMERTRS
jgi:hypothetical protein